MPVGEPSNPISSGVRGHNRSLVTVGGPTLGSVCVCMLACMHACMCVYTVLVTRLLAYLELDLRPLVAPLLRLGHCAWVATDQGLLALNIIEPLVSLSNHYLASLELPLPTVECSAISLIV